MGPQLDGDCGGVDLYVGGVEHAVLHLLYARFWHKVLFDLGHVSSPEPFRRLFNQGMIQAHVVPRRPRLPRRGRGGRRARRPLRTYGDQEVTRELGKMGKSLKNAVAPDEMCDAYGADTLRLYEMFGGPLDQSRPWDTTAVVGMYRLLQRVWRVFVDEDTGALRVDRRRRPADDTLRVLHRTIAVGPRRHGDPALQHLDRPHHRADQPPHRDLPRRRRAPLGGRAAGAAAGAAGPAPGRGAVVPAGPRPGRSPTSRSRRPTERGWSTTPSRCRSRSTARSAAGSSWRPTPTADAWRPPPGPTTRSPRCSTAPPSAR